jgi:ribosomal-protein-alanine N-acetyltransferase
VLTQPSYERGSLRLSFGVPQRLYGLGVADFRAVLATPISRLRDFRRQDQSRLVEILDDRARVAGTIDVPRHLAPNRARRWLESRAAEEEMGYAVHWAVCLLRDDHLVGYAGLCDIDFEHRAAELRFWIEPIPNSEEVASDAVQAVLAFTFSGLEFHSMRAISEPGDSEAAEILEAPGMRQLPPTPKVGSAWTRFDDVNTTQP